MRTRMQRWIYIAIMLYLACTVILWQLDSGVFIGIEPVKIPVRGFVVPNITVIAGDSKTPTKTTVSSITRGPKPQNVGSFISGSFDMLLNLMERVKGTCPKMTAPKRMVKDLWHSVSQDNIFAYSAFFERELNEIRVIAARDRKKGQGLYCHVWNSNGTMTVGKAILQDLPEHKGRR